MLFHRKSCFLCRERSRGTGFIAFIKIIAAGDAPLGQRQGGVFRVPPPCLWTPPTPQRERGCSPLSNPKAVGLHTKNPSRFAKGFFVFRRFEVAYATSRAGKLSLYPLRDILNLHPFTSSANAFRTSPEKYSVPSAHTGPSPPSSTARATPASMEASASALQP